MVTVHIIDILHQLIILLFPGGLNHVNQFLLQLGYLPICREQDTALVLAPARIIGVSVSIAIIVIGSAVVAVAVAISVVAVSIAFVAASGVVLVVSVPISGLPVKTWKVSLLKKWSRQTLLLKFLSSPNPQNRLIPTVGLKLNGFMITAFKRYRIPPYRVNR